MKFENSRNWRFFSSMESYLGLSNFLPELSLVNILDWEIKGHEVSSSNNDCSHRMLSSTYLLFESIKFGITETNFRIFHRRVIISSRWGNPDEILRKIIFKKNKQKHYTLIISGNLHVLTKCSFIDNCVIIIFRKKSNFPIIACDLIWL